jgi:hypothetical protein
MHHQQCCGRTERPGVKEHNDTRGVEPTERLSCAAAPLGWGADLLLLSAETGAKAQKLVGVSGVEGESLHLLLFSEVKQEEKESKQESPVRLELLRAR